MGALEYFLKIFTVTNNNSFAISIKIKYHIKTNKLMYIYTKSFKVILKKLNAKNNIKFIISFLQL